MTTPELISFIKKHIQKNTPRNQIIFKLLGVGWLRKDIDEGFLEVEVGPKLDIFASKSKEGVNYPPNDEQLKIATNNFIEIEGKEELPEIEAHQIESSKIWVPKNFPIIEETEPIIEEEIAPPIKIEPKIEPKEEFIPKLMPKVVANSFETTSKQNLEKIEKVAQVKLTRKYSMSDLPKMAMLASYEQDLLSVNKTKEEVVKKQEHKINLRLNIKWLFVGLGIVGIALVTWLFVSGTIDIKNLNISLIKKDPKTLLLNNSKVLSSLESYKTETKLEISSPSFADISAGLVSGEAVTSSDNDYISVSTLGLITQGGGTYLSDNSITVKSSIFPDDIITNIKNDGKNLFVSIPDLSQIIKNNIPEKAIVKIKEEEFGLLPQLFDAKTSSLIGSLNTYKILSNSMSSYINVENIKIYDEFINTSEIIEKGEEKIKGIDTYHYIVNPDRQITKKLLNKISDSLLSNLSDSDKEDINEILGALTVSTFEVWIGKTDSNIYQYHFSLDIPLSKIIGLEDKSIGDNKVNLSWQATYYDFGIENIITMPESSILALDFVNSIKKEKIKSDVVSFGELAKNFYNVGKNYGLKSNMGGSCMSPISGSLFSPTGHSKGATDVVSSISGLLNKILETTKGNGSCYSTTQAWSLTVPISDIYEALPTPTTKKYESFFCVDSTGATKDLTALPTGTVCK